MKERYSSNVRMIEFVAGRLGHLRQMVAFLGGAATCLHLTDPAAPDVRPTRDVDVIVSVVTRQDYYRLEEDLRSLGFYHPMEENTPICRWKVGDVLVDVMPTDESILGFSNQWYPKVLEFTELFTLPDGTIIRLVSAPYFLATKIEAFHNPAREGYGDYRGSQDMEDIIAILDGRLEITQEVSTSDFEVRAYLASEFQGFLEDSFFLEAIPGHLMPDEASQNRLDLVINKMKDIVAAGSGR